jgi:hypothetical protein
VLHRLEVKVNAGDQPPQDVRQTLGVRPVKPVAQGGELGQGRLDLGSNLVDRRVLPPLRCLQFLRQPVPLRQADL